MANPFYPGQFSQLDQDTCLEYTTGRQGAEESARRLLLIDTCQIGRPLRRKYGLLRYSRSFLALAALMRLRSTIAKRWVP